MSKLTENLLHAIDYDFVRSRRTENFEYLSEQLKDINKLQLNTPVGAFMYPLYIDKGEKVRKLLLAKNIYIPCLWPDVFNICNETELEYDLARNILPIPVDQRYGIEDMEYIKKEIFKCLD